MCKHTSLIHFVGSALLWLSLMVLPAWAQNAESLLVPASDRQLAADFSLPDDDGDTVVLSGLRGRVVLVNFWATWCPPCRAEMPAIQDVMTQLEDRPFTVVAVNIGEDEDAVFAFRNEFTPPLTFPIAIDARAETLKLWPVVGLPTTFLLDRNGRIAYRRVGGWEWNGPEAIDLINTLLGEP